MCSGAVPCVSGGCPGAAESGWSEPGPASPAHWSSVTGWSPTHCPPGPAWSPGGEEEGLTDRVHQ